MPLEEAKKLFETLYRAVEIGSQNPKAFHESEEEKLGIPPKQERKEKKEPKPTGIAMGLPLRKNPPLDYLRRWEREHE